MLLGDLLAAFDDETVATETVLRLGDLALVTRLRAQAEAKGRTLGDYAACAVRRFAAEASDEHWVSLMGAMTRAQDPGAVCLKQALDYVLAEDVSS
jgi:hypothetical protein